MSERLELPKIGDLPKVVLFHREHPAEPHVVLQIPNEDRTDAETYVLRMDRPSDLVWLKALPRARIVLDELSVSQHFALDTETGAIQEIRDLDEMRPAEKVIRQARLEGAPRRYDRDRKASVARRSPQHLPPVSPLRRYLGSKVW